MIKYGGFQMCAFEKALKFLANSNDEIELILRCFIVNLIVAMLFIPIFAFSEISKLCAIAIQIYQIASFVVINAMIILKLNFPVYFYKKILDTVGKFSIIRIIIIYIFYFFFILIYLLISIYHGSDLKQIFGLFLLSTLIMTISLLLKTLYICRT